MLEGKHVGGQGQHQIAGLEEVCINASLRFKTEGVFKAHYNQSSV